MEIIQPNPRTIFKRRTPILITEYSAKAPREGVLRLWMRNVREIEDVIMGSDTGRQLEQTIQRIQGNDHMIVDPYHLSYKVNALKTNGCFDDESATLLSIGIYTLQKKPPWKEIRARVKYFLGGNYNLEAFPYASVINCLDIAVWAKVIAEGYDIDGDIASDRTHAYYQSANGKILDPLYVPQEAGFFQNQEEYEDYMNSPDNQVELLLQG